MRGIVVLRTEELKGRYILSGTIQILRNGKTHFPLLFIYNLVMNGFPIVYFDNMLIFFKYSFFKLYLLHNRRTCSIFPGMNVSVMRGSVQPLLCYLAAGKGNLSSGKNPPK
jgi:hypothetical protein